MPKHVVFTGGGTAGHVIPSIPVIERVLEDGLHVSYIGSKSGLEERLVQGLNIGYYGITTGKLRRYLSRDNVVDAFRVFIGIYQSFWLIRKLKPVVVFSKGGYVAFPVVFAAWLNRVPIVAHESDLTPGLANRLSMPFVETLCQTFADSNLKGKRILVTGTAVRPALRNGDAGRGRDWLNAPADARILVIVGGSLGAEAINAVVRQTLPELTADYFVVHVCGEGKVDDQLDRPNYQQYEYISESWGDVLACADLVISRSGANTLYELLALRKLNILIPLSARASRGDQIENAQWSERHGWSFVVPEEMLTRDSLIQALQFIERDREYWRNNLETFEVRDSVTLIYNELGRVSLRRLGSAESGA